MIVTVGLIISVVVAFAMFGLLWARRRQVWDGDAEQRAVNEARSRDAAEHAGGSRHIRTSPSWRDRLESRSPSPEPEPGKLL
jgi:hypothetical protein